MNDMNTDRALSWDDEFTNEQQEFVLLPEGDYAFEVTGMERARFEGSAKLPPCSMAKLTLKIFIPFLIWHPGIEADEVRTFDEVAACEGSYGLMKEDEFINELSLIHISPVYISKTEVFSGFMRTFLSCFPCKYNDIY